MIECRTCGKEFEPFRQRKVFCSKPCLDKSEKDKAMARREGGKKKCLECGKKFYALGSAVTCSLDCGDARRRKAAKFHNGTKLEEERESWRLKNKKKKKYITDYSAIDSGFF